MNGLPNDFGYSDDPEYDTQIKDILLEIRTTRSGTFTAVAYYVDYDEDMGFTIHIATSFTRKWARKKLLLDLIPLKVHFPGQVCQNPECPDAGYCGGKCAREF